MYIAAAAAHITSVVMPTTIRDGRELGRPCINLRSNATTGKAPPRRQLLQDQKEAADEASFSSMGHSVHQVLGSEDGVERLACSLFRERTREMKQVCVQRLLFSDDFRQGRRGDLSPLHADKDPTFTGQ